MSEEKKDDTEEIEIVEEGKGTDDQDNKDDTGKTGSDSKSSKNDSDKGKRNGKTFTQDQVTKMMTKEKNQGRNAALKDLGIDPKDNKMVAMVKAMIDSQKSDEEKELEKKTEEAAKIQEANQRAQFAEAKAEAMQLGVKPQFVEDVVTLVLAKTTEDSELKTLIGELKTKYPVWFGFTNTDTEEEDRKGKAGQKGTGSSIKSDKTKDNDKDEKGFGARLAAQRKTSTKKSSYWG